jgi:proteasome lid subunit RPN8/RPN11
LLRAISRHETPCHFIASCSAARQREKLAWVRFVRNRIALPRRGEESNPVPSNTKRKNMNTTENLNSTPQPTNNIVQPIKFPQQPQEWKIVSLRECPTPQEMQLCETPTEAAAYWRAHITQHPYFNPECECLVVLMLNIRRKIRGHYFVSVGTMDTVLCDPKSIFRLAVMASAAGIIVMHNHPSGESSPSQADIQVTRDLIRGGQLLKIDVVDHIVIGNGNHSSLRELGHVYH